jgi:hypothetical protein
MLGSFISDVQYVHILGKLYASRLGRTGALLFKTLARSTTTRKRALHFIRFMMKRLLKQPGKTCFKTFMGNT